LKSATLDIQLPAAAGAPLQKSTLNPQPVPGAVYEGLLPGVISADGGVIKPVSEQWPDAQGRFKLVLPASARGKTVIFWQSDRQFSTATPARAGGAVDLSIYPKSLPTDTTRGIATAKLPG
jgi:hypothetical protein